MSPQKPFRVFWAPEAVEELECIYRYIKKYNPTAAKRVFNGLQDLGASLSYFPERFPRDPIFPEATGRNVRMAYQWSYKMYYEVLEEEILIFEIAHTKQNKV